MNISRFFGSTNREALRQVRLALGPDALIVSNRRVNGGVEILAADPTSVPPSPNASPAPAVAASSPSTDVVREIGAMRGALESRIDELLWGNQLKQSSHAATLFQSLLGCGFSTALLRAMLKRLPSGLSARSAWQWARAELTKHLPVLADEDSLWQPGLTLALVGPTGVGKTTTIAKLAARAVQRHGSDGLILLTTDTYRIGASEQLRIYGDLLRVPVKVIQNTQELTTVLKAIPAHVTVLIDNVGVSQRDRYVTEQATMLSGTSRDVKRFLVLNASSHGETLDEVARTYSQDGGSPLQGCIITKADEASSLGAALDTAIRYRLPIQYVSNGQKVPEHLEHSTPDALVDRALAQERETKTLYSPSQADFAALMSVSQPLSSSTAHNSGAGVDRLLAALLSGEHDAQQPFQQQAFQTACDAVEDSLPIAEAWDLWRALSSDTVAPDTDITLHGSRMMRAVRMSGQARSDRPVLAVHGEAPVHVDDNRKGVLRASLLMDTDGDALVSAAQQLAFPDGWWSSCGRMAQSSPSAAEALAMQINTLSQSRSDWTIVHAFERGSQAMWHELSLAGLNWISRIGAVTRLSHEGSLATASAVSKTLTYHSVAGTPVQTIRSGQDGSAPVDVVLWAATTPVELVTRNAIQSDLFFISVKVVGRTDGRVLKHLFGLGHMGSIQPDVSQLATWLVTAYETRMLLRCASRILVSSGRQPFGSSDMPLRALMATQVALASWQLLNQPSDLATKVERLAGVRRPSLSTTSVALLKLFALKKWLHETSGTPA